MTPLNVQLTGRTSGRTIRMSSDRKKSPNINTVPDPNVSGSWEHKKCSRNKGEIKANNYAKQEAMNRLMSFNSVLSMWVRDYIPELARMNAHKVGHPYEYTNSLIYWAMMLKGLLNYDYKEASGHIESIIDMIRNSWAAKFLPERIRHPDYTTVFRRLDFIAAAMLTNLAGDDRVMCAFVYRNVIDRVRTCAVDSTALNLSSTNLWRKTKWGVGPKYRGWVKVHALIDVDTNEIIATIVTTDKMGDNTAFVMLTKIAFDKGHSIEKIYADSAYEAMSNWKDSVEKGYTLVVKFKKNCNGKSNGCMARGNSAKEYLSLSYDEWRSTTKYGRRWKSECTFSDFKRLISEHLEGRCDAGIVKETVGKIVAFDFFKEVRAEIVGTTSNGVVVA